MGLSFFIAFVLIIFAAIINKTKRRKLRDQLRRVVQQPRSVDNEATMSNSEEQRQRDAYLTPFDFEMNSRISSHQRNTHPSNQVPGFHPFDLVAVQSRQKAPNNDDKPPAYEIAVASSKQTPL
jgi:hypothetical protein